ncbi:Bcsod3 [Botrytis cinerea B05.10]|uniref:Bcsod3 n=2 Tax=Botryotinia fuckeliana TaxID=40559 RepID=A0A384J555_BOTFB|nr:Bcsod3 [Botrytis cinerea B05.10]ATZ45637.1 Bcsod3 [Botrytis cinerea B05.10]CCD54975.1 similar to Fe superoxide dismutase [Botrytis cinerea T4]
MFRSRFPRIGRSVQKNFIRSISQHIPPLKHDFSNGIPEFIGPQAFELAWTSYQKLMVDKLSDAIAGVPHLDGKQPKDIALLCARDPDQAATFNYASMAFNNNFFFNCLQPNPASEPVMSEKLRAAIESSFSSVDGLKKEFVITASKMFGPGFVWLMKDRHDRLSLMTTYLAGSPFPGAHHRRQPKDMNTESESVTDYYRQKLAAPPVNTVGAHGHLSKERKPPGGIEATPILCVNTWEHVWIADYGMGTDDVGGKKVYVENWWNVIDWNVVADLAALSGNSASKLERN